MYQGYRIRLAADTKKVPAVLGVKTDEGACGRNGSTPVQLHAGDLSWRGRRNTAGYFEKKKAG